MTENELKITINGILLMNLSFDEKLNRVMMVIGVFKNEVEKSTEKRVLDSVMNKLLMEAKK